MSIWFNSEFENFNIKHKRELKSWITSFIVFHNKKPGDINYIFVSDKELLRLNIQFLNHNTLTDIISFDYSKGAILAGDIFISVDRVKDNSSIYGISFNEELKRVIIHGILHFLGFKDNTENDKLQMRQKEHTALTHVKDLLIVSG